MHKALLWAIVLGLVASISQAAPHRIPKWWGLGIRPGEVQECNSGDFSLFANQDTHKLAACQNGVLFDLLGGGGPGAATGTGTAAYYTRYANQLDAGNGGTLILSGSTTPDYSFGNLCATCAGSAILQAHNADGLAMLASQDGKSTVTATNAGASVTYNDFAGTGYLLGLMADPVNHVISFTFGNGTGGSYFGYHRIAFDGATGNASFDAPLVSAGDMVITSKHAGNSIGSTLAISDAAAGGAYASLAVNENADSIYLDAASFVANIGSDSIALTAGGAFSIQGSAPSLHLNPIATPPFACAGQEGTFYTDTSHALCYCDGTAWTKVVGAGTCS